MKTILIFFIRVYQRTLSPDHGPLRVRYPHGFCRYYPSCSEYAIVAIQKRGLFLGIWLAAVRVLKCNPFATPTVDTIK